MIIESIGAIVQDRPLHGISPAASVLEACAVLHREDIGALAVLDDTQLVGIVSERDVIHRAIHHCMDLEETCVSQIMTADPITVETSASLATGVDLMTRNRIRHLPVMVGARAVGMLSMRDIPAEYRVMVERYAAAFRPAPLDAQVPA